MITSMIREDTLELLLGRNLSNVLQRIKYVIYQLSILRVRAQITQ